MKITLFYNPKAGGKGIPLKDLVNSLEKRGAKVNAQNTKNGGYAKALDKDSDFILIAGGDGTIEKVARLVINKKIPLAILPFGNANNIANSLDVEPALDIIIQRWKNREFSKFSIGSININQEEHFFFESVGWGMFAGVLDEIKSEKKKGKATSSPQNNKKVQSGMKRLKKGLEDLQASYFEIILDGVDHSGDYLWVEIMNTQSMGPLLQLAPDAIHDDPFLDVVLVKEGEKHKLEMFLEGRYIGEDNHEFKTLKAKKISVHSRETIHIDDEISQADKKEDNWVEISLLPQYFDIINAKID